MKKNLFITVIAMMVAFFFSCVKDEIAPQPEPPPPPEPGDPVLMHFWFFGGELENNTPFEFLEPTYNVDEGAMLVFHSALDGYPFDPDHPNWRKASLERRNLPTEVNYYPQGNGLIPYEQADMRAIQVKQPFRGDGGENTLFLHIPSTGHVDIEVAFAAVDQGESATQMAAEKLVIDYALEDGGPWLNEGLAETELMLLHGEYKKYKINFSAIELANDNPELVLRIRFDGSDMDADEGNRVTFNNISVHGKPILGGEPAKVVITSINNDDDVFVGKEFSIDVRIVDADGLPAVVDEDVTVTLSVEAGTGELGGNTTAVVEAGKYSVSIASVTYSVAEEGVAIKAAANGLEAAVSESFDVLPITYVLELQSNIADAGELIGGGEYAEDEEVTIEAIANEGFEFLNWSIGEEELSSEPVFTFIMPAEDTIITANFETTSDDEPILLHYWHFNDLADETHLEVESDYSAVGQGLITYPGTGDGYMDIRTHRPADPVSNFNLRMGQEPDQGAILRVRNPADTRELLFKVPSTGFENIKVTFATTRSSAGGQEQEFYFSSDNGNSWTQVGDAYNVYEHDPDATNFGFEHKVFDLSGYPEINDNSELVIRIMSVGVGSDGDTGNQRFDNFSVDAYPIQ